MKYCRLLWLWLLAACCFCHFIPVLDVVVCAIARLLYCVDMGAVPLANDRAKAVRFGLAFVSCFVCGRKFVV